MDVMLVGTNKGKILKIVMTYNGTHHVPLISEELSVSFPKIHVWCVLVVLCEVKIPQNGFSAVK